MRDAPIPRHPLIGAGLAQSGQVPAHLRPAAPGERAASEPDEATPPPAARSSAAHPRPAPRRARHLLRPCNAELPPAPGVILPGLSLFPRLLLARAAGLAGLCANEACRRGRACADSDMPCWRRHRRELETRFARMSDRRRAGLYRRAKTNAHGLAELRKLIEQMGDAPVTPASPPGFRSAT